MSAVEWIIVVFGAITGYGLVGAVLVAQWMGLIPGLQGIFPPAP